jgi:hypothetical protein
MYSILPRWPKDGSAGDKAKAQSYLDQAAALLLPSGLDEGQHQQVARRRPIGQSSPLV